MIMLLAASAAMALEFGVSGGVAVAPATAEVGSQQAPSGSIYGAMGFLGIVRGEAHVQYTAMGTNGVDAVNVSGRAVDLRALGGVALPVINIPGATIGADFLVGPDLRLTHTSTEVLSVTDNQLRPSVHMTAAVGPYITLPLLRFGLRGWVDVPDQTRLGLTAMAGVRF